MMPIGFRAMPTPRPVQFGMPVFWKSSVEPTETQTQTETKTKVPKLPEDIKRLLQEGPQVRITDPNMHPETLIVVGPSIGQYNEAVGRAKDPLEREQVEGQLAAIAYQNTLRLDRLERFQKGGNEPLQQYNEPLQQYNGKNYTPDTSTWN